MNKEMVNTNCLSREEIRFLEELGVQGDLYHLSQDSPVWGEIEDKVGDELMFEGLDENYEPNQIGRICESILGKIPILPNRKFKYYQSGILRQQEERPPKQTLLFVFSCAFCGLAAYFPLPFRRGMDSVFVS